ncbi:UGSC family (seleno)protein [Thermodesulfobacteriota bacterium]
MGIPTAPLSTHAFKEAAERGFGHDTPFIYTKHPVVGVPDDVLTGYIKGEDPETGNIVFDEIIDALTKPPVRRDVIGEQKDIKKEGFLDPDTEDNLQRLFYERGWTDGLPVILPTRERVQRMLAGTSASPNDVVAEPNPFNPIKITVANVAVIAVMAGARPEHLPVILAIASTGERAILGSTTPFAPMIVVNGPIRNEIGMNSGIGAFSPINAANSAIGRAWTLLCHSTGGNRKKVTLWSSQGNTISYNNLCIAENEERSVWDPFHVQKGFKPDESVVSIFRGWTFSHSMGAASLRSHAEEAAILLQAFSAFNGAATLILDPLVAKIVKESEGCPRKEDFSKVISETTEMTADRFWKTDYVDFLTGPMADKGVEPYASWRKLSGDSIIKPYHDPDKINIIVTGGETGPFFKACDFAYVTSSSIDKWRTKSGDMCEDGSCGLPDELVDYD